MVDNIALSIMKIRMLITLLLMSVFFVNSCKKEDDSVVYENTLEFIDDADHDSKSSNDGMIVLGNIQNDPYKFENMLQARNQLANERVGLITPTITATHKYMRIKPRNENDLDALKADTNLVLWDYPLHYEIVSLGSYYHDPSIADTLPTWQYFVVPNDYQLPVIHVRAELIYNLYFPEENSSDTFYDELEERAYQITGNILEGENMKADWWTPTAVIKAYDDIVGGYIPLQGVEVTARRFTKFKTGITDANGYCAVDGSFKNSVNYSIKWERGYWDIRNGVIGQAYYNGPYQKSQWVLNIARGGKSLMFATIHRAAHKFYYGSTLGVKRPILSVGKTKIAYLDRDASWGTGCCWGTWDLTGIVPNIFIAYPHESTRTEDVFSTTIHELGHQSHLITLGQSLYVDLDKEIHESWAAAIEWSLTNHHYNEELGRQYSHYAYQDWYPGNLPSGKTSCYTPIFIDLIDTYNQFIDDVRTPNDRVYKYNISTIQNTIIPVSRSLQSLYTVLDLHRPSGITRDDIRTLMIKYWDQDYARN